MTFRILDALPILVLAYGETINKVSRGPRSGLENVKVMGFRTGSGRLLALHTEKLDAVRLWFDMRHPVSSPDVIVSPSAPDNHDLTGDLGVFRKHNAKYAEFTTADALRDFISSYS